MQAMNFASSMFQRQYFGSCMKRLEKGMPYSGLVEMKFELYAIGRRRKQTINLVTNHHDASCGSRVNSVCAFGPMVRRNIPNGELAILGGNSGFLEDNLTQVI